ncbi:hypothetical protein WT39_01960 [Burkholderia territorii]|nr:hypothetical protein WT39_01960 [Burkholderia territorii]
MKEPQILPLRKPRLVPKLNILQILDKLVIALFIAVIEAAFLAQSCIAHLVICTVPFTRCMANKAA